MPFRKLIKPFFRCLCAIVFLFAAADAAAQVGIGINPPDNSAILHIQDTARGLLIPRMTAAQKLGIANPADGLMIYQTDGAKGFWYYNGNNWGNVSGNNGGAPVIVLTDDITDAEAQAKITAEGGPNTREIKIIKCTNLTTVDLSMITELTSIVISKNPLLQSVDLRNLVYLNGGEGINITEDTSLAILNLSSLKKVAPVSNASTAGINIDNTKIANFNFPVLEKTLRLNITNNRLAATLSAPSLQTASYLTINYNEALSNLSFPVFKSVFWLTITNNLSLASVSLPVLTTLIPYPNNAFYGTLAISGNTNLSSIDIVPFTTPSFLDYSFAYNKLNANSVNNILNKFVAMGDSITGKTINLSHQNPIAPPTGQGLIDKATLLSQNNTVTTD